MRNTPDNIRAAAILKQIKGYKVEDNKGNQYSVADVKYASLNCYMEMASVA